MTPKHKCAFAHWGSTSTAFRKSCPASSRRILIAYASAPFSSHVCALSPEDMLAIINRFANGLHRRIAHQQYLRKIATNVQANRGYKLAKPAAGARERRAYLCRKERFLAVWYTKCPQI